MAIKDEQKIRDKIEKLIAGLIKEFDIGWLKVVNKFDPRNLDTDRVLCESTSDWEYRQTTLLWNLHQISSTPDDELVDVAIHEIVHSLLDPLWGSLTSAQQDKLGKVNELATENITRVISKIRETAGN